MNFKMMRRLVGRLVLLDPPALSVDERGAAMPRREDPWSVDRVDRRELRLRNIATDHAIAIGAEHIRGFELSGTTEYTGRPVGYLKLRCQVVLQGRSARLTPIPPGDGANVYVPIYGRPAGEVVLPLAGTPNKTAEAIAWLVLGVVAIAALEHWLPSSRRYVC